MYLKDAVPHYPRNEKPCGVNTTEKPQGIFDMLCIFKLIAF